jgi:hypothetical protein
MLGPTYGAKISAKAIRLHDVSGVSWLSKGSNSCQGRVELSQDGGECILQILGGGDAQVHPHDIQ